jgi:hypothetical protein
MGDVLKVNMIILSEIINVHVNVTYGCCSGSKYENIEWDNKCSCECYLYTGAVLEVYMKNIEWDNSCLCKCYIWVLLSK